MQKMILMNTNNEIIWIKIEWFYKWNFSKTAFSIKSPWKRNALIWFNKIYYRSSQYVGWFGVEINLINVKTKKEHIYQEVTYSLAEKEIREVGAKTMAEYFKNLSNDNSEKYRDLIKDLDGKKIFD